MTGIKPPFFYGWVIVGVGFVAQLITGVAAQGFASYLIPLGQEFGWSRATMSGPRSLTQVETALLGPVNGWLVDKFGPRVMMGLGALVLGGGLVMFGFIQNLWQFYVVNIIMALGASFAGLLVVSMAMNTWFRRKRTTAMGITTVGFSVAGFLGVPLVVLLQTQFDWRTAAIVSGLAVWAAGIPASLLLRPSPESMGLLPDGDLPGEQDAASVGPRSRSVGAIVDFSLGEAMRTRTFWLISVGNGLNGLVMSAVMVHQFLHMGEGVGLSAGVAAAAFAFMNVINMGGRLVGGVLGDRFSKNLLLAVGMLGTAGSLVVFAFAKSLLPVLVFGALYGFCWGTRTPMIGSIIGEYFGRSSYGKINGTIQSIATPLSVLGPVFAGFMADQLGDYVLTLLIMAVFAGLASGVFFLAVPPVAPVQSQPDAAEAGRQAVRLG